MHYMYMHFICKFVDIHPRQGEIIFVGKSEQIELCIHDEIGENVENTIEFIFYLWFSPHNPNFSVFHSSLIFDVIKSNYHSRFITDRDFVLRMLY